MGMGSGGENGEEVEVGGSAQPLAPERKHARTSEHHRRVPSIGKPLCRDPQPDPAAGARGLGKGKGRRRRGGCAGHSSRTELDADKPSADSESTHLKTPLPHFTAQSIYRCRSAEGRMGRMR